MKAEIWSQETEARQQGNAPGPCPPAASTLAAELECDQETRIFRQTWQIPRWP